VTLPSLRIQLAFAIFMISVLGGLLLSAGLDRRATLVAARSWTSVKATITAVRVEENPPRKNARASWSPSWSYRYEYEGRWYEGSSSQSSAAIVESFAAIAKAQAAAERRPPGSEVEAFVNPSLPAQSVLDRASALEPRWLLPVSLGVIILLLALGVAGVAWRASRGGERGQGP
jgi:hypothetical protein